MYMYMVFSRLMYVYGLQQYGKLNISRHYVSCFVLFCNLKKENR